MIRGFRHKGLQRHFDLRRNAEQSPQRIVRLRCGTLGRAKLTTGIEERGQIDARLVEGDISGLKRPPGAIGLRCVSLFEVGEQFALFRRIDALDIERACLRDRLPLLPKQTQPRRVSRGIGRRHFGRLDDQRLDIVGETQPISGDDTPSPGCRIKIGGELRIGQYAGSERLGLGNPRFPAAGLQIRIVEYRDGRHRIHVERLHGLPWKPFGQVDLVR